MYTYIVQYLFFCDKIFFTDSFVNKREGQIKYGDR